VLGAIHQFEKTSLVAKLKAARDRKKAATGKCGGRKSYAEARPEVVSLAKESRDEQCSLRQISALLAEQGYVTAGGKPYVASAVLARCGCAPPEKSRVRLKPRRGTRSRPGAIRWSGSVDVCGCAAGTSGPLLAQARRRRRAKARRKPHATKRAVIGTASPRLNRSADNASDTADNANNTAAATATLKARFIPGSSKRPQGIERLQRGRFGHSQSPQFTTPHSIPTGPPVGTQKIGARAQIIGAFGRPERTAVRSKHRRNRPCRERLVVVVHDVALRKFG
jgi:hypothetical protein